MLPTDVPGVFSVPAGEPSWLADLAPPPQNHNPMLDNITMATFGPLQQPFFDHIPNQLSWDLRTFMYPPSRELQAEVVAGTVFLSDTQYMHGMTALDRLSIRVKALIAEKNLYVNATTSFAYQESNESEGYRYLEGSRVFTAKVTYETATQFTNLIHQFYQARHIQPHMKVTITMCSRTLFECDAVEDKLPLVALPFNVNATRLY